MNSIVYIADIDQDIDDLIAMDYLNEQGFLQYVVLDSEPQTEIANERVRQLQRKGILIEPKIKDGEVILFVGGSLTKVRAFLMENRENRITQLVMNGGFVGSNVVASDQQLKKFKGELFARTYNFNLDVASTEFVLASEQVEQIYLIGKNVCHSEKNTKQGIWKDLEFLKAYTLSNKKRLHDLLMVNEGLKLIHGNECNSLLRYEKVHIVKIHSESDKMVKWGSERAIASHIRAAVSWKQ